MQLDGAVVQLFDPTNCELGEGPLWHPKLNALFWFDILNKRLLMRGQERTQQWQFDEIVSAAGWVDETTLLIASESALLRFDITTGAHDHLVALEADNRLTRSNDGRADPWGGFWIGTMGKQAEPGAGSIYRYFRGQLHTLFTDITITNAIAFTPDKRFATFADTTSGQVMRVALDGEDGMPVGEPEVFLDLRQEGRNPDGAIYDADGSFWLAEWGSSRVACYDHNGVFQQALQVPTPHTSCPAWGGAACDTLFITTAREGLTDGEAGFDQAGQTYHVKLDVKGKAEPQVKLLS